MEPYGSMHGIAWKTYEFGSGYPKQNENCKFASTFSRHLLKKIVNQNSVEFRRKQFQNSSATSKASGVDMQEYRTVDTFTAVL